MQPSRSGASDATAPPDSAVSLFGLDPRTYGVHALHRPGRTYVETNCYTDIWIELLHAAGCEPLAAMGMALEVDFEGDQWTFFKPAPEDLRILFGIDVHEMQPYRALPDQLTEQISQGRTLLVEVDSWYLPDVESTAYRTEHVKTTIGVETIDCGADRLVYFHNAGLFELMGDDYRGVLRVDGGLAPEVLTPYVELVRFDAGSRLAGDELRATAASLLRRHLDARPADNPFPAFGSQLETELSRLLEGGLQDYHAYAFATVRMLGSAFDLAAAHVDWVLGEPARPASDALLRIVGLTKSLSFKLARLRPFDTTEQVAEMGSSWDEAMATLDELVA